MSNTIRLSSSVEYLAGSIGFDQCDSFEELLPHGWISFYATLRVMFATCRESRIVRKVVLQNSDDGFTGGPVIVVNSRTTPKRCLIFAPDRNNDSLFALRMSESTLKSVTRHSDRWLETRDRVVNGQGLNR